MAESETPRLDDHVSQSEAKPAASEEYRHDARVATTTNSSSSTGANAGEGACGSGGPSASSTTTHHHHKPRFSALNINQRFLQSATAATAPKPALASAPPLPADESRTGPSPRLVTAMPSRMSAAQYHHHHPVADASRHKEASRDAPAAPRMPWANVNKRAPVMPAVSSQDFPTAKEVMEAERKAEERAAAHAAEEHARQQAMKEELERFRGTELMSHDHWDELEDESEDEMDDVVEFGDGTQYKISEVEEEQAKHAPPVQEPPPPPAPRVPAWGPTHRPASLLRRPEPPASSVTAHASSQPLPHSHPRAPLHAHHHLHAQPHHAPATVAAPPPPPPVSTWGPLAQRHSTLTGKPMPKLEPTPSLSPPPLSLIHI